MFGAKRRFGPIVNFAGATTRRDGLRCSFLRAVEGRQRNEGGKREDEQNAAHGGVPFVNGGYAVSIARNLGNRLSDLG